MSNHDSHIIHKVFVEVDTNSSAKANELRSNIGSFVQENILGHVTEYFSKLDKNLQEQHIQINRLDLNLVGAMENFASIQIREKVFKQLDKLIQETSNTSKISDIDSTSQVDKEKDVKVESMTTSEREQFDLTKSHQYSSDERNIQAVIHFIKTGTIPWWIPTNGAMAKLMKEDALIRLIEVKGVYFNELFKKQIHKTTFLKRIIHQFSDDVLLAIFATFYNSNPIGFLKLKSLFKNTDQLFKKISSAERYLIWTLVSQDTKNHEMQSSRIEYIFSKLNQYADEDFPKNELIFEAISFVIFLQSITQFIHSKDPKVMENFNSEVKKIIKLSQNNKSPKQQQQQKSEIINPETVDSDSNSTSLVDSHSNTSDKLKEAMTDITSKDNKDLNNSAEARETKEEKESFIAENTGLILLHPFLKMYFTKVGLMNEENELTDPTLAAYCLHYAATGRDHDFEFEMTFEKYLCGIPLSESIPKDIVLSKQMKEEIDQLLSAVLTHWKALKSKSIELLRNEFLQREGKIVVDEMSPRIVVERKTIDIMLDKLPWAIGMVKLPWKKEFIYVEW